MIEENSQTGADEGMRADNSCFNAEDYKSNRLVGVVLEACQRSSNLLGRRGGSFEQTRKQSNHRNQSTVDPKHLRSCIINYPTLQSLP